MVLECCEVLIVLPSPPSVSPPCSLPCKHMQHTMHTRILLQSPQPFLLSSAWIGFCPVSKPPQMIIFSAKEGFEVQLCSLLFRVIATITKRPPEATSPWTLSTLNFPMSGEWHSELLQADTECKNSLHILLTSHYKLTDMPQLLERTNSPPSSTHLSCKSSQSLLCATQITETLLGHSVPSTSHSVLLVLAAYF